MLSSFETDRLYITVLYSDAASQVLAFYDQNRPLFEPWEPKRAANFYTISYQNACLMAESHQMAEGKMIRYWIFLKNHPEEIIGTVCFHNILSIPYQSSFLGYKISGKYEHLGYAFESIQKAIEVIYETNHIHRIEAYIMPNNSLSLSLIKKLGFHYEGLCISYAHINGRWEDHERYALINPQDLVGQP